MVVGVLHLEILLHAPQSIKEKRSLVKKLLARCRNNFPVSAAEVGAQDLWQRTHLGFAMVHHDEKAIHQVYDRLDESIEETGFAEIVDRFIEILHY
ncbi:DUF503 domain-containing protein [Trichloromonas sp.]|uniref:DUF503 domain-containing protein n=1 Tax=Trichloromonas sp. TaxID=3069249 RepID=UPI002A4DFA48|nr:DUF503 domain-containing protein [Trichloromonas sp.]